MADPERERHRVGARIKDTPGADPLIQHRASEIARATYLEAFKGIFAGAVTSLGGLFIVTRRPQFRKYWTANNITAGTLGGAAFGAAVKSASGVRNAMALDLATSPVSDAPQYEATRSKYMNLQIQEHNKRADSLDERFDRRREAIAEAVEKRHRERDDPPRV